MRKKFTFVSPTKGIGIPPNPWTQEDLEESLTLESPRPTVLAHASHA